LINAAGDVRSFLLKVCGITTLQDGIRAVEYGANALGFNFYPGSPRFVEPEEVRGMIGSLPNRVLSVAVVVPGQAEDQSSREILAPLRDLPLDVLQLHGLQSASEVPATSKRLWIATSPGRAHRFPGHEILIDTSWGRGRKADWDEVCDLECPFILSGGLTAENVGQAIRLLQPIGVDVCSGVESSPGIKDASKLQQFLKAAREAADQAGRSLH
jgi:phosphoribosylanthranilate isomerase